MTALAHLAAEEFSQRLAFARRARAEGRWSAEEANARVMPWLAIALAAGAEPAEAAAELDYLRRDPATRRFARSYLADCLCDHAEMLTVLARARDAALAAALASPGDRAACARSQRLQYLAVNLGCPATEPLLEAA